MSICGYYIFFFKLKTAYEVRISDWSSDVCSSDLCDVVVVMRIGEIFLVEQVFHVQLKLDILRGIEEQRRIHAGKGRQAGGRCRRPDCGKQIGRGSGRERVGQSV